MPKKRQESRGEIYRRVSEALSKYKNSFEVLPLLGGKISIPEDIIFLLDEIKVYQEKAEILDQVVNDLKKEIEWLKTGKITKEK